MFTRDDTALVLIDHQVGTLQLVRTLEAARVEAAALALAKAARVLDLPVVITTSQEDRVQGSLLPALAACLPEAYARRIKRDGIVNAWCDDDFRSAVEATGRNNLLMAGVTTDVCLVFAAISATEAGYAVQAVLDASGSPFALSEAAAQERMRGAGVTLTAANTAIAELAENWSGPGGQELIGILFADLLPAITAADPVARVARIS